MADTPAPTERRRVPVRLIVAGVVVVLVVWFAIANSQRETIDFIVFERESRLIYIILGSAVLGAVAGALVRHRRQERRRERRRDRD